MANSTTENTAPTAVPATSIAIPAGVAKTASEEVTLVSVAVPRNSAKTMWDRKFQNRKKITITAAIDGICRSFCRRMTPNTAAGVKTSPASIRREIS